MEMADTAGNSSSEGAVSKAKNFFGTKMGKICLIIGGILLVAVLVVASLAIHKHVKGKEGSALIQVSRGHGEKGKSRGDGGRNGAGMGMGESRESRLAGNGDEDMPSSIPEGGMEGSEDQPQSGGRTKKKASAKEHGGKGKKGGKAGAKRQTKAGPSLEGMAGSFLEGLNEIKLNAITLKDQLSPGSRSGSKAFSPSGGSSKK
jgi:hypothetical protein